jgi:hypothetical protein
MRADTVVCFREKHHDRSCGNNEDRSRQVTDIWTRTFARRPCQSMRRPCDACLPVWRGVILGTESHK